MTAFHVVARYDVRIIDEERTALDGESQNHKRDVGYLANWVSAS
jgi:hypothetical protein